MIIKHTVAGAVLGAGAFLLTACLSRTLPTIPERDHGIERGIQTNRSDGSFRRVSGSGDSDCSVCPSPGDPPPVEGPGDIK